MAIVFGLMSLPIQPKVNVWLAVAGRHRKRAAYVGCCQV